MPVGIGNKVNCIFCDRNLGSARRRTLAQQSARIAFITTALPMATAKTVEYSFVVFTPWAGMATYAQIGVGKPNYFWEQYA